MLQIVYMMVLGASVSIGLLKFFFLFRKYQALTLFLFFVLLMEAIIYFFYSESNTAFYNWFTLFQFQFLFFFFGKWGNNRAIKKWSKCFLLIYPICFLVNVFLIQGDHVFHTATMLLGSLMLAILAAMYFYFVISEDITETILWKRSSFWLNSGLLFFYVGSFIYLSILNYLITTNQGSALRIFPLINILNIIYYGFYSVVFIINSND